MDHNRLDPEEIPRRLPVGERERFVHEYRSALDAAHEVWRYRRLQEVLHLWNLRAAAYGQADFEQRAREASSAQPGEFVPAEQVFPGWTGGAR